MKLYYSPGACSLACHIALAEAGASYDLERVNLGDKKTEKGSDYRAINPKGAVPAVGLPGGEVLTENAVILQYIADQAPQAKLAAPAGTMAHYRLLEWLNFIATEVHKGFGPLFHGAASDAQKAQVKEALAKKLDFVAAGLGDKSFLLGEAFSLADTYLFVMLRWASKFSVAVPEGLRAYQERLSQRPGVRKALAEEGLSR